MNMFLSDADVVIAGAGPAGLMLAAEMALAGVEAVLVERRASQDIVGLRAGGLHARTIELLDQRGIADRFLSEGQVAQVTGFAGSRLDLSELPTRYPYVLGLWQNHIERILAGWVQYRARADHRPSVTPSPARSDRHGSCSANKLFRRQAPWRPRQTWKSNRRSNATAPFGFF
jgi:2-polyprenyl-6-methoxyphenol hydroxylase-like FAD-dependent oxidoreductase